MAMPAVARLREHLSDSVLDVWTRPGLAALWRMMPAPTAVRETDDGGLCGPFRMAPLLRRARYGVGLLLTNSLRAALSMRFARLPARIGAADAESRLLLTHRVNPPPHTHQVDCYLALAACLGATPERCPAGLAIPPPARAWAKSELPDDRRWVAVHAGAAYGDAKRWPADRFARLIVGLVREQDLRVVLIGSAAERPGLASLFDLVEAAIPAGSWGRDMVGATTIEQLAALLSRCAMVVGNDSGPLHLASALGVPVLAVFGPTDARVTGPWGPVSAVVDHRVACAPCLRRQCDTDHACMLGIDVAEVERESLRLLARREDPR